MIDSVQHWPLFIGAGLLLNITPGADMALVVARAAAGGARLGAAAALGVGAGSSVHVLAGALGLSALLASAPGAFNLLRWLGAAYLVWLGLGLLRGRAGSLRAPLAAPEAEDSGAADARGAPGTASVGAQPAGDAGPALSWARVFGQGFLTNALNPKVALFFLAFVPQFIAPGAGAKTTAFVLAGLVFSVNGTLVNLAIALAVARLAQRLRARRRPGPASAWPQRLNRLAGAAFVALGLKLAFDSDGLPR